MFSVHEDGVLSRCSTLSNIMMSACDAWGLQSALSTQQIPEVKKKIKKNLKNVLLDSVAQAARGMLLLDLGGFHNKQLKFPECQ